MAPTTLPSVSSNFVKTPTVWIGAFSMMMRPPCCATALVTPGLEAPAEHGFVEPAAALDVVGVNGEAREIVGYGARVVHWCY